MTRRKKKARETLVLVILMTMTIRMTTVMIVMTAVTKVTMMKRVVNPATRSAPRKKMRMVTMHQLISNKRKRRRRA